MAISSGKDPYWTAKRGTVQDGLVFHVTAAVRQSYPGTGNTWYDLSGGGNHSTLTNGVYYTSNNGGVINFDGINDYTVANSPSLTYPFTVSYWMQSSNMQNSYVINIGNEGSTFDRFIHGYVFDGSNWKANGRIFVGGQLLSFEFGNIGPVFPTTFIHQVIVWRSINNREVYLNGSSAGLNITNITQFPTLSKVFIGGYPTEGRRVRGAVDDVRIYNKALTTSEIQQNFNATRKRFGV